MKNEWFLLFLLIPFFRPGVFLHLQFGIAGVSINDLFLYWRLLSIAIVFLLFFLYAKIDKFIVAIAVYLFIMLFSTIFNGGDLAAALRSALTVAGVCMLVSLAVSANPLTLLKVISRYLGVLVIINLALFFILGGGIVRSSGQNILFYFLGNRNGKTTILVLTLLVNSIYSYMTKKRLSTWALIIFACIIITLLNIWSATGVVACFMLITFIFFIFKGFHKTLFNFKLLFSINIGLFFFIVIFRMQDYLSFIIEYALGRSLTFTDRTFLWDYSIDLIMRAPFVGQGFDEHNMIWFMGEWLSPHNAFLNILILGGIFALLAYLVVIIFSGYTLTKYSGHPISSILSVGLFVYLVASLTEVYLHDINMFVTIALAFNADRIIKHEMTEDVVQPVESKYIRTRVRLS